MNATQTRRPPPRTLHSFFFFLKRRRPQRSPQAHTLFPYTTLFRSEVNFAARSHGKIVRIYSFRHHLLVPADRKSTRLNSSHVSLSRMPSSARKQKIMAHITPVARRYPTPTNAAPILRAA